MQTTEVRAACAAIGAVLNDIQAQQIVDYAALLTTWNTKINLTAITDPQAILKLHFVDALTLLSVLPDKPGLRLIDVGTGAGFPGLPVKIARPDVDVTVIDGTAKKITFCTEIIRTLRLDRTRALHTRSEDLAHDPAHRERYDVVVARAVAALPVLVEYLLPFAKPGGLVIAMKGSAADQETQDAHNAIRILGGAPPVLHTVALPDLPDKRALIVIEKRAPTPARYPRPAGAPRTSPLK
jgi:16S rRNA (guanine527-N7)-methyltransferase